MNEKRSNSFRKNEDVSEKDLSKNNTDNQLNLVKKKNTDINKEKNGVANKKDKGGTEVKHPKNFINTFEKSEEQVNYFLMNSNRNMPNLQNWEKKKMKQRIEEKNNATGKKGNNKTISYSESSKSKKSNESDISEELNKPNKRKKHDEFNGSNEFTENLCVKKNKKANQKRKIKKKHSERKRQVLKISKSVKKILNVLNLPKSEILGETPIRMAKVFLYLLNGYNADIKQLIKGALYERKYENYTIVKLTGMNVYSLCKHHLLPFQGRCTIEYKPNKYILGLSKFSRIIDVYSKRLQLQEDLTNDICEILKKHLKPLYVIVTITAKHMCVSMRGVKQHNSETVTQAFCEWKNNKYVKSVTLKNGNSNCTPLQEETYLNEFHEEMDKTEETESNMTETNIDTTHFDC